MFEKWFKKKDKQLSHLPSFVIEVEPTGNININASWAKPLTPDELHILVRSYVGLLMLLNEGKLTPIFQHAISLYGENNNDVNSVKAILSTFHSASKAQMPTPPQENRPLILPTEAFRKG